MKKILGFILAAAVFSLAGCEGETDVVVVGSGAAGFSAAMSAAQNGAKVVLFEQLGVTGGSSLLSGGFTQAAPTKYEQAAGTKDSAEALANYWIGYADKKVDVELVKKVASLTAPTIDWLADNGMKWAALTWSGMEKINRVHIPDGYGPGYIKAMQDAAKKAGVELVLNAKVVQLTTDGGGAVNGVVVERDGKQAAVKAKAVILGTGGFAANAELMRKYAPSYVNSVLWATKGNTGSGLTMSEAVGADIVGNKGIIGFWCVAGENHYTSDVAQLSYLPLILVNADGKRFVDETTHYALIHKAISEQKGEKAWAIYDAKTFNSAFDKAIAKGVAFGADDVVSLAKAIGADAAVLGKTVSDFNAYVAAGKDAEYNRDLSGIKAYDKPKYYAVKIVPINLGTMTGVRIDTEARVIGKNGKPIVGLYASGEVANGTFFNETYPGSGSSLAFCAAMGRVAGKNAAFIAKNN